MKIDFQKAITQFISSGKITNLWILVTEALRVHPLFQFLSFSRFTVYANKEMTTLHMQNDHEYYCKKRLFLTLQ